MTPTDPENAVGALALYRSRHASICDVIEPWEHGTIVRAGAYPDYWDFNLIRVENDPAMSVAELIEFAEGPLGDLRHRRFDFERIDVAEPLRPDFEAAGWVALRLLWMHHGGGAPSSGDVAVREVPYDDVIDLRVAWHQEDFPEQDPRRYQENARLVSRHLGARVFAVHAGGRPVAFAQLDGDGAAAEITQVYVHPDERGNGIGTSLTASVMEVAKDVGDLWICADDEDRPKDLYARLGFRPALTTMEFTLMP